ncbi:cytochrome b/b6 domain-containing protein [bacterium]|nr:cytochrome b/b6 domain-containing protein [bacterium]
MSGLIFLAALIMGLAGGEEISTDDCTTCHAPEGATEPFQLPLSGNDLVFFSESVHNIFSCTDCHAGVTDEHMEQPPPRVDCTSCHTDEGAAMEGSVHHPPSVADATYYPVCWTCHGKHSIFSSGDARSHTYPPSVDRVCSQCHDSDAFRAKFPAVNKNIVASYRHSTHSRALHETGNLDAAACNDCHGSHDILPGTHEKSSVNRFNLAGTCGQCHEQVSQEYLTSIHGELLAAGNRDTPVCTYCHGEHYILNPRDPESPLEHTRVSREICSPCHNSVVMSRKYGLRTDRVATYEDSYHGLATRFGSTSAANCATCHGVHNILPSSDPRSMVHKANLPATCGQCHPRIRQDAEIGPVHTASLTQQAELVRRFYMWVIVLTLGGMVAHNLLIHFSAIRRKLLRQRGLPKVGKFNANEIVQHWVLAVSFIVLVITGFAITMPDAGWVQLLASLGMTEHVRNLIHKIAGVVLLVLGAYHLFYVILNRHGRYHLVDMIPRGRDVVVFWKTVRYYLGLERHLPDGHHFTYVEKVEYWAVVWGTVVMGVTGILMWRPDWAMSFLPSWMRGVNQTIHLYEAFLATFAIIVWHLYAVFLHPRHFPFNTVILTGLEAEEDDDDLGGRR